MVCKDFDTCTINNDAKINEELWKTLRLGQSHIQESLCADAAQDLESISALFAIPLIQSVLYFSDKSMDFDNSAAGYVASMAILPIVKDVDPSLAQTIETAMSFPSSGISHSKSETVYGVFRAMLSNPKSYNIDCILVSPTNRNQICDGISDGDLGGDGNADTDVGDMIDPDKPMPISDGLYVSTNYVGDRSSIALDVKDIRNALNLKDVTRAKFIYSEGLNSKIYGENGMPTGELRTISSFSENSVNTMQNDPTYNLFVYGLSDEHQEFMGKPVVNYADSYVTELLFTSITVAPDAMVALHIWMQVAHKLHSAYKACKSSFLTDGRTIDGRRITQNSDASLFIDEAAAYWIGDNQSTGSSSKGNLLYALTEFIGEKFEDIPSGSQSWINTRVIDLLNQAKNHIAISKSCSTSKDSHLKIRSIVDEIIPMMAVTLLRCLFYYLSIGNAAMTKLYAVSVLPLFSACSPSTFLELKTDLIDLGTDGIKKEYIFSKIQNMYDCLGLTCDVVGFMPTDDFTRCDDSSAKVLAGYKTMSERSLVVEVSF